METPGDPDLVPEEWRELFSLVDSVRFDVARGLSALVSRKEARRAGKMLDELDVEQSEQFYAAAGRALLDPSRIASGGSVLDFSEFLEAGEFCEVALHVGWKAALRMIS